MKNLCAWCNQDLGAVDSALDRSHLVTHGICEACAQRLLERISGSGQDFLDVLPAPVLLIDADRTVIAANKKARKTFGKEAGPFKKYLGGDFIECAYAGMPGGCGSTEHCKACAVRLLVEETYRTGQGREKVPAYQDVRVPGGVKKIHFFISTEKINDAVLLRIDEKA